MRRFALLLVLALAAIAPVKALAAERPARFDLGTGTVNGRTILGKQIAAVTAGFGRPDARERFPVATYIRYGSKRDFRVRVEFRRRAGRLVATSFEIRARALVEARLGRLLSLRPAAVQDAIASAYGREYELSSEYQCLRGECVGGFAARRGGLRVNFGLNGRRTFIKIWRV